MTENFLHIVIPFYSNTDLLDKCLSALEKSDFDSLSIILVDHSTSGIPAHFLKKYSLYVECIRASSDLWWSGATNLGIKHAFSVNAKYIMLLNHDCMVHRNTIGNLVMASETLGSQSVVAPIQHDTETARSIVRSYSVFTLGFPTINFSVPDSALNLSNDQLKTKLIIGGRGVIIPTEIFKSVGLFNESLLPHYGADHDFYLRCRQMEISLYIAMNAIVDVDSRSSSDAANSGKLGLKEFFDSLISRNSHRNIYDLAALFRLHYPVRALYPIGLVLNIFRYTVVYFSRRFLRILYSQ